MYRFDTENHMLIMGILNVTPDSFSDGGLYFHRDKAVERALRLESEGADIIDIGAVSTRPGHEPVSVEEEQARLLPVLKSLRGKLSLPISVDTTEPDTARAALEAGASIINDVSGVVSEEMAAVVRDTEAGWIIMHTGGGDADRQREYSDICSEVYAFFMDSLHKCEALGVLKKQLCFDVGFGFGKSYEDNMRLLEGLNRVCIEGVPLLAALSRKRMIGEATGQPLEQRLEGTLAANTVALYNGASIIRVHDVKEHTAVIKTVEAVKKLRGNCSGYNHN